MLFHVSLRKTEKSNRRIGRNIRGKQNPRWISSILPLTTLFSRERGRFYHVIKGWVFSTIADLRVAAFHHHFTSICLSSLPVWSLGLYWHRENRINILSGFVWPKDTWSLHSSLRGLEAFAVRHPSDLVCSGLTLRHQSSWNGRRCCSVMKCHHCTGDSGTVNTIWKDAFVFPSMQRVGRQEKRKETDDLLQMITWMSN